MRLGRSLPLVLPLCLLLVSSLSFAGAWRVSPIRLTLGRAARTGVIKVINDADDKLQVQMNAFEWTEGPDGKDHYTKTKDLLFFPKIMVLEKKEERILRVGIRMPAVAKEKAYRLYIQEIPTPSQAKGTSVAIAIRFGVPIFVEPLKAEARGEIESIGMDNGVLATRVANRGNVHFTIQSIVVKGKSKSGEGVFSKELSGWYLLPGASRLYSTKIPPDKCRNAAAIDLEVKTDRFTLPGKLDADSAMCEK